MSPGESPMPSLLLRNMQRLDKKSWQHCCHITMVSARAASFMDMNKDCQRVSAANGKTTLSICCSVYNVDFHKDSASVLRPCLQNELNVPGSYLKWHDVIVHKNVFRDCVEHLVVQHPSFFLTMQGVVPLLLSRTSCADGNGRYWNIQRSHPIRVHAFAISSAK